MKGIFKFISCSLLTTGLLSAASASAQCIPGRVSQYSERFETEKTGYFPDDSEMEGGFSDRSGRPLKTLQDYVAGRADYVSVAMDSQQFGYGTVVRIPDVEEAYGKCILFKVVDTGGRFEGAGSSKIDICNANESDANSHISNGRTTIYVVDANSLGQNTDQGYDPGQGNGPFQDTDQDNLAKSQNGNGQSSGSGQVHQPPNQDGNEEEGDDDASWEDSNDDGGSDNNDDSES